MALELKADERPCLLSFLGLPLASLPAASASTELCSQFPENSLYPTSPCPGTLITAVLLKGAKRARKATLVSPVYLALAWGQHRGGFSSALQGREGHTAYIQQ